jgi:hypothetical protein
VELTQVERQDRVRALYGRLHEVLKHFDMAEAEKFRPDLVSEFWEGYDLLDQYCARYIIGGVIDWEFDVLGQATYLFNMQHEFGMSDDLKRTEEEIQLLLFK